MWLQRDGAPAHFDRNVRNHLNVTYRNRWIGRGGPVPWKARTPYLTPLDYILRGSMNSMVYVTPVTSEEDLTGRVHGAIESLTRQPYSLGHVHEAQHHRCRRFYSDVGDTQFELVCNVVCTMCCTCSVCCLHVERTLRCSTAPKPCCSGQGFPLEKQSVWHLAQHT